MIDRPRILLTRRWPEAVERHLTERYRVTLNDSDVPLSEAALCEAMRTHDAICPTVTDAIGATILESSERTVRIIANYGVGTNHIDVDAARRTGIIVTNTPDVLTDATADLAILLMLMATRRAGEGERQLRSFQWSGWRPTHLMGQGLTGKTLGLVGFGRIAQATARRAHQAFGMRIVYFSRRRVSTEIEQPLQARYMDSLDDMLATVDVLSLHCPGGAATYHLIDGSRLARMKSTAVLINTARGTVVDEAALAEALHSRRIAAAGLDVYEHEPKVHAQLLDAENAVLLPHLGSATQETRIAMGMRVAINLDRYFAGEGGLDKVN
jgi:lactate dehydrogenase-like 2-hydroxyacid dehydrogenase